MIQSYLFMYCGRALLLYFAFALLFFVGNSQEKKNFTFHVVSNFPEYTSAYQIAIEDINSRPDILPNTHLELSYDLILSSPAAIEKFLEFNEQNVTLVLGNESSSVNTLTGVVGDVYGIASLSSISITSELSNKNKFPLFSRLVVSGDPQVSVIIEGLQYYSKLGIGWTEVGIICHTDRIGLSIAEGFIDRAGDAFTVLTFQQFLPSSETFDLELNELKKSGSRVILAFMYSATWNHFITAANGYDLIGENYVWITAGSVVGSPSVTSGEFETLQLSRGVLGPLAYIPRNGDVYNNFYNRWINLNPEEYSGAGSYPSDFVLDSYDTALVAALAAHELDLRGELHQQRISGETWTQTIRQVETEGTSGDISFTPIGDRDSILGFFYFQPETKTWLPTALWDDEIGYTFIDDVIWFSNTTDIPDIDIRPPFDYWSCHDGKLKTDETGKTIFLLSPGSSDVNNINSHYHCDHFIDCQNMSDESKDCLANFIAVFIAFGIITGFLILICILLLIFVFIFGIILQYRRLRVSSPSFLMLMLISIVVGFASIFAWYGKPHPVACGFQPWLLGLSAISMISSLCVKTFRIWKIFRRKMAKQVISDIELFLFWALLMVPAFVILLVWTIVSTPTAKLKEVAGNDHSHYVCATGGFTGEPGGIVFFSLLVAYGAVVILLGAFLSIATRNVPAMFNESKLLAISIYNLGFLTVVIIPVFLVVNQYNPYIAWILRTCAILYAFTATLCLQFAPPIFGILVIDKGKNIRVFSSGISNQKIPGNGKLSSDTNSPPLAVLASFN